MAKEAGAFEVIRPSAERQMPLRIATMRFAMGSAFRIKESAGTTLVTRVGKFASAPAARFGRRLAQRIESAEGL